MDETKKAEQKPGLTRKIVLLVFAITADITVTVWYCIFLDNTGEDLFKYSELFKDIGKLDWFILFCLRLLSIPIRIFGKRYGFSKILHCGTALWAIACFGLLVKFLFVLFASDWKNIHHWIPLFPAIICGSFERLKFLLPAISEVEPKPQGDGFEPLLEGAVNEEDEENKKNVTILTSDTKEDEDKEKTKEEAKEKKEEDEEPPAPKMEIFRKLLRLFMVHCLKCVFGLIALLAVAALGAFGPYVFGKIIDEAGEADWGRAEYWLLLFFACGVGAAILNLGQAYVTMYVIADVKLTLKRNLLSSILHQETGYFDTVTSGELTSRINNDCNEVTDRMTWTLRSTGSTLFNILWTIVFAAIMDIRLTIASFVCLPLVIMSSGYFGTKLYEISRKETDLNAKTSKVAQEAIGNVRTVKSFACENYEVGQFNEGLMEMFTLYKFRGIIVAFFWSTYLLFPSLSAAVVLFFGVKLIKRDELTLGQLAAFMVYQETIMNSLNSFGNQWTQLISALGSADKIFKIIEREPEVQPTSNLMPDTCHGEMEIRNVSFAYPKDPDKLRLKNIDLKVNPGQIVALVGPSGGGKSTILNLLEYFYKPKEGMVLFDGKPVSDYDPHFLHAKIAIVDQTPTLFARSILDNIAYGDIDVQREDIIAAAKMANAHEFILNLSKGYETEVGERGVTLSGGQRQRISIARALVRKPTVLLLDEATASLDSESEHLVHQAIDGVMKNHTVLIVAHRLSTVKNADLICVIDDGAIVERGTHETLLKMGGVYSTLIEKQIMK